MPADKATGKRKAETAAAAAKKISQNKNPHQLYFEEQTEYLNQDENKHLLGSLLIKGIEHDPDGEEDEEEEEDTSKYTTEQMQSLRFIFFQKNLDQQIDKMRALVLGDQANDSFLTFNTSFSYHVLGTWDIVKKRLSKIPAKNPSHKLDLLIAYTYTIKEHDVWMHDNEGGMGELVQGLANAWKRLLSNKKYDDEALGWDLKYTKPGVLELLHQFKQQIEDMDECYDMGEFNYE